MLAEVPDAVCQAMATHFNAELVVELTANIAGYSMVVRFMEALDLQP